MESAFSSGLDDAEPLRLLRIGRQRQPVCFEMPDIGSDAPVVLVGLSGRVVAIDEGGDRNGGQGIT